MSDLAAFTAGARAGRQFARELASAEQLRAIDQLQQLSDSEMFAASVLANECYFALFPERDGDEQASWAFWQRLGGAIISREFVSGFIDGAVNAATANDSHSSALLAAEISH